MASSGLSQYAHASFSDSHQWLADAGDIPTQFVNEPADSSELQSLTPPFRLFKNRDLTGCQPKGSSITQDLDYYATHTATACAQACIEWNSKLDASGDDGVYCNVAVYKAILDGLDPASFITSTGLSTSYSAWNCWVKVVKQVCGPQPPLASYQADGVDMMVMQTNRYPCALSSR